MNWRKLRAVFMLAVTFPAELWGSSVSVLRAALSRQPDVAPAIIALPLRVKGDFAIVTLANLITLTPGTTTLHVSDDRTHLYIHCLQDRGDAAIIRDIRQGFERWLLELES